MTEESKEGKEANEIVGTKKKSLPPEEQIRAYFLPIIFVLGILIVIGLIVALALDVPIFRRLHEPGFARGVITFLISVATIGLGFVLVFHSMLGGSAENSENSFRRSREIFAGLMGVLGTIVGFYFGSTEKVITPLEILEVRATEQQVLARVQGGTPPYGYLITSDDKVFNIKGVSEKGWIVEDLKPPAKPGLKITVEVTDNKQQKTSSVGTVSTKKEGTEQVQKQVAGEEKEKPSKGEPTKKPTK